MGSRKRNKKPGEPRNRSFLQALNASSIGLVFFLSIAIGGVIGYYLDKYFDTKPYLLLFFLVMGIIAGFRNMWQFIKKAKDDSVEKDDK